MGNIGNSSNEKAAQLLRDEESQIDQERTDEQIEENNRESDIKAPVVKDNPLQQKDVNEGADAKSYQVNKPSTRTRKAPIKAVAPQTLIEKLEGQIAAIKYIETVVVPDIPQLPLKAREILISMTQQIDKIKVQALLDLQSL